MLKSIRQAQDPEFTEGRVQHDNFRNMVDLSIIIVSYNTKDFIGNCLASILSSIKGKFD